MRELTVIAPTFNEAENIAPFVSAVSGALAGVDFEILICDDDSPDCTWQRAEQLSETNPRVRVLRRISNPGLAAAVADGMVHARGEVVACIDADLQHDPSILPAMLGEIRGGREVVVGTRYMEGGGVEDWGLVRRFGSWFATKLGQLALGVQLRDPMSGYFMLRRASFLQVREQLTLSGFKILLEIIAQLQPQQLGEVPYTFRARTAGESKLSNRVVFQYLKQLWRLNRAGARSVPKKPPAPIAGVAAARATSASVGGSELGKA